LTDCVQAASSPGPPNPSDQPNTGGTTQQTIPVYITDTSHKVLAAASVIVVLAAVALSRSIPSSSPRTDITFHPVTRVLMVLGGVTAWALGIAGFATSFTSTKITPDPTRSITRRDTTGNLGFVQTDHAIAGTILFALAYVIAPLFIIGRQCIRHRERITEPEPTTTRHADDKGAISRRSNASDYPSRPANERSGTSHRTQPSISGPITPEDDVDMMDRNGENIEDEPMGAGKRVRLAQKKLSAPTAFFKEQLWPGKPWAGSSKKRERVSSHPLPPSPHPRGRSTSPTSPTVPSDPPAEGGGGFVVLNRGRNALDRRTPPQSSYDLLNQRRAPTNLGEVSWLERRRNVNMINDLDYAMSQQNRQPSPVIAPSAQYSKPLLSSHPDGELETDRRPLPSYEFPARSTVVLHCLFHLLLLALCIFTASSIFQKGDGTLATPLGAVFVVLVFGFYVFVFFLAMRSRREDSVISVIISRLRVSKGSIPREMEYGMDEHSAAPETKHLPGDQSPLPDTTTLKSSRAFIQQVNEARGQDPHGDDDEDDAEDIEREMGRRDVSAIHRPIESC
jgi:hypothetical protein